MACAVLTETMSRRHQLRMDSYDRLFPNQDTLPPGGFGNLIALPLQHEARQHGNTVFVDDGLEPPDDQWDYLASTPENPAQHRRRHRRACCPRGANPRRADEPHRGRGGRGSVDASAFRAPPDERIPRPFHRLCALFWQRLFVEKSGLPSPLGRNPPTRCLPEPRVLQEAGVRFRRRSRRASSVAPRSTRSTSRFREGAGRPLRPAGRHGISLTLRDEREAGEPLGVEFSGELTPVQERRARAAGPRHRRVRRPSGRREDRRRDRARRRARMQHARPRAPHAPARPVARAALVVPRHRAREIGRIGGGGRRPNGLLDVAMVQAWFGSPRSTTWSRATAR